jgi:hypothetical protein
MRRDVKLREGSDSGITDREGLYLETEKTIIDLQGKVNRAFPSPRSTQCESR